MPYLKLSDRELLQAALIGYERQREVLGERIAEITRELSGKPGADEVASGTRPKRVMSAETRRRMAEAQQRRWAGAKKSGTPVAKKKRKMSAAGRERIAEATRKRWEAFRAAKAAKSK
jgi:hypothetical protein